MKGIGKPVVEFVGWRWAPTVGLLSAAVLYVGIVVALVPEEIGGPVPASRTVPTVRPLPTAMMASDQTTFSARTEEPAPQPVAHTPPPSPVSITPAREFGRRGFSPPLERPAAPPEPVVAPPPIPPPPPPVIVPPPAVEPPAVAVAPQGPMQRGLVGAAFNAARRVAGMDSNVNGNTGNVAPVPGQPGAAPVPDPPAAAPAPPPGAPGAPTPGAPGAPPAEAPPAPGAEVPVPAPIPVQ